MKKATGREGRLASYLASACHTIATQTLNFMQNENPVATLHSQQLSDEQHVAQNCLELCSQVLATLRASAWPYSGMLMMKVIFMQLLRLRKLDTPELRYLNPTFNQLDWCVTSNPCVQYDG